MTTPEQMQAPKMRFRCLECCWEVSSNSSLEDSLKLLEAQGWLVRSSKLICGKCVRDKKRKFFER